jgi:DNA-binding transcriptional LysR family regulator
MVREPDWHLYRTFLGALRTGSLSAAARRLRVTQPTVGRQIEDLENALGFALFTRSQAGLAPTAAALDLLPMAETMEAAAAAVVRTAEGAGQRETLAGTVRITASEVMGAEVLPPMLAELRLDYPRVAFELALSNRQQNLLRRDADIAVRSVQPEQTALVGRKLGEFGVGLYAHRGYAKRRGLPQTAAELGRFDVIGFDRDDTAVRAVAKNTPWIDRNLFNLRVDNDLAQLAALRAGLGIGAMQHLVAARDPDLVPVLAKEISFKIGTWIVMHEDQRANLPVRLIFEGLGRKLAAWLKSPHPTNSLGRRGRAR